MLEPKAIFTKSKPPEGWDKKQQDLGASFVQSAFWGNYQQALGKKVRFFLHENWSALCIEQTSPFGKYWLIPYGPTAKSIRALTDALDILRRKAKKERIAWLKVEPRIQNKDTQAIKNIVDDLAYCKRAVHDINPARTIVNDLTKPEEELRMNLSATNRNVIKRAINNPAFKTKISFKPQDVELFIDMQRAVISRNKVSFHNENYYRKQAKQLMPTKNMWLGVAYFEGKPVATTINHSYNGFATYTYAASYPEARKCNANPALAWQVMMHAKKHKHHSFDFWGIAPDGVGPDHPWFGFTQFKKKFAGKTYEFTGTYDVVVSYPRYTLYRQASSINRARKSFVKKLR